MKNAGTWIIITFAVVAIAIWIGMCSEAQDVNIEPDPIEQSIGVE